MHAPLPVIQAQLIELAPQAHAGVIDDHGHRVSQQGFRFLSQLFNLFRLTHITVNGKAFGALGFQ